MDGQSTKNRGPRRVKRPLPPSPPRYRLLLSLVWVVLASAGPLDGLDTAIEGTIDTVQHVLGLNMETSGGNRESTARIRQSVLRQTYSGGGRLGVNDDRSSGGIPPDLGLGTQRIIEEDEDDDEDPWEPTFEPSIAPTESPTILQPSSMAKPSLEETMNAESYDESKPIIRLELSVAIVERPDSPKNMTHHKEDTLNAIVLALNTIIQNDTQLKLWHQENVTNYNVTGDDIVEVWDKIEAGEESQRWTYSLKLDGKWAREHRSNVTCQDVSNDTLTVTWLETAVNYLIVPSRNQSHANVSTVPPTDSAQSHTEHQDFGLDPFGEASPAAGRHEGKDRRWWRQSKAHDSNNNDDDMDPPEKDLPEKDEDSNDAAAQAVNGTFLDWLEGREKVVNATKRRIHDGTLLTWIQEHTQNVVGVAPRGQEESARCQEHPDMVIPFMDPFDFKWGALQIAGSVVFGLTVLATMSLCLIGRSRSKAIKQWPVVIGDESAVDDFLALSRQYLPPECINQRDGSAAILVTIPVQDDDQCHHRFSNHA